MISLLDSIENNGADESAPFVFPMLPDKLQVGKARIFLRTLSD
jgi:hypothetical protein